jgi:hypothetical protein
MHKAAAVCLTLARALAIFVTLLVIGLALVLGMLETMMPSVPVADPALLGMLLSVAAVTLGPTALWLLGRNWRRRTPAEPDPIDEAASTRTVIFVLASLLAVWLALTLLAADIALYVVALGILLLWLWLVARRRTRRALAPSMGRGLIILVATVTAPMGLLLLSAAAPWTLAPHQGTVDALSAEPSYTDSDSPDGDTMGGTLVLELADHACAYRYPIYHHRLHAIEAALQVGDSVGFLAPALAGQACGYGIEIVDLRHDGKLVLHEHSQRSVRALSGAALLVLGLVMLFWWVRGTRRRR